MTPTTFSHEIGHFAELLEAAVSVTPYLKRRAHNLSKCARELAAAEAGRGRTEVYEQVAESLDGKFGSRPLPLVVHQLRAVAEMIDEKS